MAEVSTPITVADKDAALDALRHLAPTLTATAVGAIQARHRCAIVALEFYGAGAEDKARRAHEALLKLLGAD